MYGIYEIYTTGTINAKQQNREKQIYKNMDITVSSHLDCHY